MISMLTFFMKQKQNLKKSNTLNLKLHNTRDGFCYFTKLQFQIVYTYYFNVTDTH